MKILSEKLANVLKYWSHGQPWPARSGQRRFVGYTPLALRKNGFIVAQIALFFTLNKALRGMDMHKIFLAFLFVFATTPVFSQAQNEVPVSSETGNHLAHKCLTDQLSQRLHAEHPDGVPGRNLPHTAKADDYQFVYVIPVVVHVLVDGGLEIGVTLAQANSQIEVLNEDYNRYGSGFNQNQLGADARIQFCLASIDPEGQPTDGIEYIQDSRTSDLDPFTEDTLMKRESQWDPNRYMNIWVVRTIAGNIEGYAYFPEEVAGTVWDGYVVEHRKFGRGVGTAIDQGRTGSHEVGHYLGLMHPWGLIETTCFALDDGCDDTPNVSQAYYSDYPSCISPASCDGTPRMIANYMDYSDDRCMNTFTICQADIMRRNILLYRSQLVSSENLTTTGCTMELDSIAATDSILTYPNPADDVLMIYADIADAGDVEVEIYDNTGRKMYYSAAAGNGRGALRVDVSTYNAGWYHVMVRAKDTYYSRRTIWVQH